MGLKRFEDQPDIAKRVEFGITFWDGRTPKRYEFAAFPEVDAFAVSKINILAAKDSTAVEALTHVKNAIRAMMDDSDGTPTDWTPTQLPPEAAVQANELAAWPDEDPVMEVEGMQIVGALDDEEAEPQFLSPQGTVHPMRDARKFMEFEAGSSRRRYVELMDGDNNLTIKPKTLMKVWQWLISEVAERPTVR